MNNINLGIAIFNDNFSKLLERKGEFERAKIHKKISDKAMNNYHASINFRQKHCRSISSANKNELKKSNYIIF